MGRKRVKINPIRGQRLKKLLNDHNMTSIELAEKLGYSPGHVSYILNGRRNLTEEIAAAAARLFPPTRKEWILAYDDFMTENERQWADFDDALLEQKRRLNAVRMLAYLAGYDIELFQDDESKNSHTIREWLDNIKEGYKITKNGSVLACCPLERFNLLALEIQELAEWRIQSYIREVSDDGDNNESN